MEKIWNETLDHLKLELSDHTFNTWLRPIHFRNQEENLFILEVPNNFYRDRIQQSYADLIRKKLRQISHSETIDVSFVTPSNNQESSLLKDISRVKKEITKQTREA